jgi:hypothetical protein
VDAHAAADVVPDQARADVGDVAAAEDHGGRDRPRRPPRPRYRIGVQPGLGVRFAEVVGTHLRPIETSLITRSRGAIRFTPALGPRTRRTLIAQTVRAGVPGARSTVGSYTPGAIPPGTASRIAVRHVRGGWRISWRPGANATAQQLTVRFIDGEEALLAGKAAQGSLVLPRSFDQGAQPTAIAIVALRGTTRGRISGIVAKPPATSRR